VAEYAFAPDALPGVGFARLVRPDRHLKGSEVSDDMSDDMSGGDTNGGDTVVSSWPTPFPDTAVDRRTPTLQERDRAVAEEQSQGLADSAGATTIDETLADLFAERRQLAGDSIVQFEVAGTATDRQTLVVRGELLLRRSAALLDNPEVGAILREYGFLGHPDDPSDTESGPGSERPVGDGFDTRTAAVDAADPPVDSTTSDEEPGAPRRLAGEVPIGCRELDRHLARFVAAGVDVRQRREAIGRLAAVDVTAALTAVESLQPPKKPAPVVVKHTSGASPAEVADADSHASVAAGTSKRRVLVAVIDTGISRQRRTDGWLEDVERSPGGIDLLDAFPVSSPAVVPANRLLDFGAGHGTFAAGIIRQVDPLAEIRMYAALDSDGLGSELTVACAMIQAVKDGAQVINLSLGMRTVDNQPSMAIELALDLIDELTECRETPVFVAAAGNFGDTQPVWPAASRRVVAVGGLTPAGSQPAAPAVWSSRGVWVDCSTVGQGIVSTYVEGIEDPAFGGHDTFDPNPWAVWTGTSFAAPQIAGAIARTIRETGLPPQSAARRLIRAGTPIADFGRAMTILPGS